MFVCLLDELILCFCYLTLETGGFELASTITLVLQANRLTKCASHPKLGYKLSREDTQPENMCNNVFEKTKRHAGKVNRTIVYAEAAVRRVL